jgi:integrase
VCFNRAVKRGDLESNPCTRATPPPAPARETQTWSLAEAQEFFCHPDVQRDPDFVLWKLAWVSGLRRGELLGLQWSDVDFETATINVTHNAVVVYGKVEVSTPKTARSKRRVKIGPETVAMLREHRARQLERRVALAAEWNVGDLVFPNPRSGKLRNPVNVSRSFSNLVRKVGAKPVTMHALRHAHASLLLDRGERIHDIAIRLGHDPRILMARYAHSGADAQDRAAALESLIDKRPALRVVGED